MTLRQQYARTPPPRHRRPPGQPGRAAAPAHTGPQGDQPEASTWPRRATAPATQPAKGRPCPIAAPMLEPCPQPRARHRLRPHGMATQTRRPLLHFRWPAPAAGSCRSGRHPAPPVSLTGGLPSACAAGSPSSGLLPQVAGLRPLPVGVLWASCRPLCVVGPPAAGDGGTSRDGGPARSATGNPAQPGLHHRGDRNAPHPSHRPRPQARNG